MPKPMTQRTRAFADAALAQFCRPMPVTQQERDLIERQSRRDLRMAREAGANNIKQHTNPATVPA